MGWLKEYEFRRRFEFKMKDNPLIRVNKGCSDLCEGGYHVGVSGELHLHGKVKSFPEDIVFTSDDGVTILKAHLDFVGCTEGGKKLWVKFAVDRKERGKIFKGYIYYGRR